MKKVDARGLECPQPVLLAKKALEETSGVEISVDNNTAVENLKRLGTKLKCSISIDEEKDGTYTVTMTGAQGGEKQVAETEFQAVCNIESGGSSPLVVVISSDRMGKGDDELGDVLIRGFIHTLTELDEFPESLIFYNAGVKLAVKDSPVVDDLLFLEEKGTDILVCGTCTNFFQITGNLGAGHVSNMYDIADTMTKAGRLVSP
jgi:selenium metabolism protein YedF